MYAIRRHRRRLLFPPGLLALGFLLLLGCWVIGRNAERLKKQYVMQLIIFPPLPSQDPILAKENSHLYMPPSKLEHFRPWQTVLLNGNIWQDYFSLQQAQAVMHQLHNDPNHDRGLRIRFGQQASYANLIWVLDYLYRADINKYWLDIHHEPTTLYTFTTYQQQQQIECYGTIVGDYNDHYITTEHLPFSFRSAVQSFFNKSRLATTSAPLLHPDWRNSLYLLLLLILASCGQLLRQWRRA